MKGKISLIFGAKGYLSPYKLLVSLLATLLCSTPVQSKEIPEQSSDTKHWGGIIASDLWLTGVNANVSNGARSHAVNANFIDIADKSRRFPLGFSGRFEAHYDKFAFYIDGNYINVKLKPKFDRFSEGLNIETGVMDYGLMYRIFGANASEMLSYQGKQRPVQLDVYAGARTIWLGIDTTIAGPFGIINRTPTMDKTLTSPVIGARTGYDFTPNWFVLVNANIGGFGAQKVELTSNLVGAVGYRTTAFNMPVSIEAGYNALYYKIDKNSPSTVNMWMNGPFLGFTGYW